MTGCILQTLKQMKDMGCQGWVTYLYIGKTMLVWAVWLLADAILQEGSAHRHALWIELM